MQVEQVSQRGSLLLFRASGDLQEFLIKLHLTYQLKISIKILVINEFG